MRLESFLTPRALAYTIGSCSRTEIEGLIEHLIDALDEADAPLADCEPEPIEAQAE